MQIKLYQRVFQLSSNKPVKADPTRQNKGTVPSFTLKYFSL